MPSLFEIGLVVLEKVEKRKSLQTDRQTDDERQIRKARAFSSGELKTLDSEDYGWFIPSLVEIHRVVLEMNLRSLYFSLFL